MHDEITCMNLTAIADFRKTNDAPMSVKHTRDPTSQTIHNRLNAHVRTQNPIFTHNGSPRSPSQVPTCPTSQRQLRPRQPKQARISKPSSSICASWKMDPTPVPPPFSQSPSSQTIAAPPPNSSSQPTHPPHWHEMHDEFFPITKGTIRFSTTGHKDAKNIDAETGTYIAEPLRAPHTFDNPFDEEQTVTGLF